jgi:ribosomal-protein-alanine N-acetyltransferase
MEIKKLNSENAPECARIEMECFSHPWSENSVREEIENLLTYCVGAFEGDALAGYAGMHLPSDGAYIDNIAVRPGYRRKGAGKMLLEALIEKASQSGAEFITLEVRPSNTAAFKLYTQLGFKEAGRRKGYYEDPKEDAIILTKEDL